MILKAKERGNARQLAIYLLSMRDNEHVELHELRGFVSDDLEEAFEELEAIASRTKMQEAPILHESEPAQRGASQPRGV